MGTLPYMFVCLCYFLVVNGQVREIQSRQYDSEVAAVLTYLNSTPFRVYNYKEPSVLNAVTKADITELGLEVQVDCVNSYPDVPCSEKALTCSAFVQKTPEGGTQVLGDVNCKPKPQILIAEPTYEPAEVLVNEINKSIALSNEAVSSEVGEPFVAVRNTMYPCLGCPVDLNPNVKGVDELIDVALQHIESEKSKKQTLVRVLKLQQQVVWGVKFFLLAEVAPTVCDKDANLDSCPRDPAAETSICEITYYQKPWISKAKHVISNNCTVSQEYVKPDSERTDVSNEIDSNNKKVTTSDFDHMTQSGTIEYMRPSSLGDLESQIMVESDDFIPRKAVDTQAEIPSTVEARIAEPSQIPTEVEIESSQSVFLDGNTTELEERAKRDEVLPKEERNDAAEDDSSEEYVRDGGRTKRSEESSESDEHVTNSTVSNLQQATNSSEENSSEEVKARARRSDESPESDEHISNSTVSNLQEAANSSEENSSEETKVRNRRSEESAESLEATLNATLSNPDQATNSSEEDSSEEKKRPKRAIPQLEKISPEEKGLVRNLADFAAAALDNIDDDNHRRIILQILGAKKMVGDDGVYYHLIMRMGISRCLEDKPPNPYENCRDKLLENYTKICKVQVFVNDDFGSPKVVKSQCQNIKRDKNDSNRTNYSRFRREVIAGGTTSIDKNSEKVKELLRLGVTHLNVQSNKDNKYKPLEVISATSQVVAGALYNIKVKVAESDCSKNDQRNIDDCNVVKEVPPITCEVQVWEKSWQNFRKFTVRCDNGEDFKIETQISRTKRDVSGGLNVKGGRKEVDKNRDDIKELFGVGMTHLNARSNGKNKYKPVEMISATSQVVAGILYEIKAKVAETDCSKNDLKNLEDCNILQGATPTTCEVTVWEKVWENFREFTINCENGENHKVESQISRKKREIYHTSRIKRQLVLGGASPIDKNDKNIQELVGLGVTHLNTKTSKDTKYKPVEVVKAKQQVVQGFKYLIEVKVAESDCSKNDQKDLKDCNVRRGATPTTCEVEVWEKSWQNFRKFTITCENGENHSIETKINRKKREVDRNSRVRREVIVGGVTDIDKDSKEIQKLLGLGVTHLNTKTSKTNKYRPVKVLSATSQPVAGVLYKIKAKLAESDCSINDQKNLEDCSIVQGASSTTCEVAVWEKVWENFREFTIKCENGENHKVETQISRRKRSTDQIGRTQGIPGSQNSVDKNSKDIKELLGLGVVHLNTKTNKNNRYKPVEVISATMQVVAGFMYRIKVKVVESDCSKEDQRNLQDCNVLQGSIPTTCEVRVWEKGWENFREFTIKCENGEDHKVETKISRKKREIDHTRRVKREQREQLVGGVSTIDKNGQNIQELVGLGVTHLNTKTSKNNKYKPLEVVSAKRQVVQGFKYILEVKVAESDCLKNDQKDLKDCNIRRGATPTTCKVDVWEKSWQNFRKFTITCENGENHSIETKINRKKRQALGGESALSKDDELVLAYLEGGLNHLDSDSSHENKYKIQEVISATSQVVSGFFYRIKAKVILSDCKKNTSTKRSQCGSLQGERSRVCDFVVLDLPATNSRQTNITCDGEVHSFRSKRAVGDYKPVSTKDDFVDEYLESGLRQLDARSPDENKLKVDEVFSVTKKTVSGHVYVIKAKVVLSDCKKTTSDDRRRCGTSEGAIPQFCKFKIYEAVWRPNSRVINVTCDDDKYNFGTIHKGLLGDDDPTTHFAMFNNFIQKYNKRYGNKEFKYRLKVFSANLMRIRLMNTYEQGSAWYGVTKFADLTQDEFSKSLGLRTDLRNENEPPFAHANIPDVELPTEFDWRKKGAVTEVKDQEQCGSCWAFSVTGNIEGQYSIKHGKLLEFSEQELVDCDTEDQGCNGGLMDTAYRQIEKLGGLETEQEYPYDAEDETCHFNRSLARVQLTGALNISHNETDMAKWLVANGPISIAINANAMQFYMGGVSHPFKFLCNPKALDHGVLIVGYGVHTYSLFNKTLPYWIVKNSWGKSWGEQGYYRVYRGDGTCGLNQTPSSAIVS